MKEHHATLFFVWILWNYPVASSNKQSQSSLVAKVQANASCAYILCKKAQFNNCTFIHIVWADTKDMSETTTDTH